MTQTIQPCSWKSAIDEADKDLRTQKPETKVDMSLLLTLFNNLNNLYDNMNNLNCLIKGYVSQSEKLEQFLNAIKDEGGNADP